MFLSVDYRFEAIVDKSGIGRVVSFLYPEVPVGRAKWALVTDLMVSFEKG